MDEVVKLVVDTIYSYDNISRLAWLPKKRSLSLKQTAIDNIAVMKSLVLKRDVQEIYNGYLSKHSSQFPPFMMKSLFYTITREISGGSRPAEQELITLRSIFIMIILRLWRNN